MITSLNKVIDNLAKAVKSLDDRISNISDPALSATPCPPEPKPSGSIATTIVTALNEEKEKEKRRLNLIFHNLPESVSDVSETRKTDDIKAVREVISDYLGAHAQVSNVVRLGKKTPSVATKPRLLKITVDSVASKTFILRNCTKLRNADQSSYLRKVYISPDLTPTEREANKHLRSKLQELNKDGRHYKIKNGQIVRRTE